MEGLSSDGKRKFIDSQEEMVLEERWKDCGFWFVDIPDSGERMDRNANITTLDRPNAYLTQLVTKKSF